jgi:hypothetical protein
MRSLSLNQTEAEARLARWKVGALFMEAGTGKTQVAVNLVNGAPCSFCLWVGPLRTLGAVKAEIERSGGLRPELRMVGVESLSQSSRIYLETMEWAEQHKADLFMVVDESLKIKNAESIRTKRTIELGKQAAYKLILNGTPLSKNLLDLWPQMEFLSPKILSMDLRRFKNTFCNWNEVIVRKPGRTERKEYITGYENVDYLHWLIKDYVYACDLSLRVGQFYHTANYRVGQESRDAYREVKEHFLSDNALDQWNNNIFLAMTQKMQIAYSCDRAKIEAVNRIFASGVDPAKTIIFCKFIKSRMLCEVEFPKCRVLSYQKESFGLNLQEYHTTIYFDKTFEYALKLQSGRRTWRTGQESDCTYYELTGDMKLESLIDRNIAAKIGMSEYFKSKTKDEIMNEL